MNTSNNTIQNFLKAKFDALKDWFIRYSKIVLPVILVICVGLTIVIATRANRRKVEPEESAVLAESGEGANEALAEIPLVPLEKDAVPGMNEFFETYYKAVMDGDTETMSNLLYYLDATEKLRAAETSKYTESASIEVYTKAGPSDGTYIALVYTEIKFYDYDKPLPGMSSFYVCTKEDGSFYIEDDSFYINEDYEPSESERRYMREVLLQDDVIDLNNKVAAAYNDMVTEDSTLANFLRGLAKEIEKNVGETLTRAEGTEQTDSGGFEPSKTEDRDAAQATETEEETMSEEPDNKETVATSGTVTVKENVRIRSGASETSDKLATAYVGEKLEVIMKQADGWTKIKYKGRSAYVKSDYVE